MVLNLVTLEALSFNWPSDPLAVLVLGGGGDWSSGSLITVGPNSTSV